MSGYCPRPAPQTFIPVAYTHLVAYGVDTLVFEVDRNGDYDFFVWDRCGWAVRGYPASTTEQALLHRLGAVSYTHLDVYKRQVLWLPERKLHGRICELSTGIRRAGRGTGTVWRHTG